MSPALAMKHIRTLIDGAASIANERQQRLLLQAIAELTRKGLEQPSPPGTPLSLDRSPNFRWDQ